MFLVEGFHLSVSNGGSGSCIAIAGIVFNSQFGFNVRRMARLTAFAGDTQQVFIELPRAAIVRPDAILGADLIATNVLLQTSTLGGGTNCSQSLSVFSRAAP